MLYSQMAQMEQHGALLSAALQYAQRLFPFAMSASNASNSMLEIPTELCEQAAALLGLLQTSASREWTCLLNEQLAHTQLQHGEPGEHPEHVGHPQHVEHGEADELAVRSSGAVRRVRVTVHEPLESLETARKFSAGFCLTVHLDATIEHLPTPVAAFLFIEVPHILPYTLPHSHYHLCH